MLASCAWLAELLGWKDQAPVDMVASLLTRLGLEVEDVKFYGALDPHIMCAEVRKVEPVADREGWSLLSVWDGESQHPLLSHLPAERLPQTGQLVAVAFAGATLPSGKRIESSAIKGKTSAGILCSEAALEIGYESEQVLHLNSHIKDSPIKPGQPLADSLALKDSVLTINVTPNRPDCLGHLGLARELAVATNQNITAPEASIGHTTLRAQSNGDLKTVNLWPTSDVTYSTWRSELSIEDAERCPRYGLSCVKGVTLGLSPFWARYRLFKLGMRAVNNVVDATNLVMLLFGHPVHAFDASKLRGNKIVVRRARDAESMTTLDGNKRTFTPDDLLICDGEGPVGIAGVMGGENSEITNTTKDVAIECAYFEPRGVRRTSRRSGLHTEASHRFERGVDPQDVPQVMAHTLSMVVAFASGEASVNMLEFSAALPKPAQVRLRQHRLIDLSGCNVSLERASEILGNLGCEVSAGQTELTVTAPPWRTDLHREVDLIEEVLRVEGYDKIPFELPRIALRREPPSPMFDFVRDLRHTLTHLGFYEAVNYAFIAPAQHDAMAVPVAQRARLKNPLSVERSELRASLLPGLFANVQFALRRQSRAIRLFEVGHTFHQGSSPKPEEYPSVALVLSGPQQRWLGEGEAVDFYDIKGVIQSLVLSLTGVTLVIDEPGPVESAAGFLHPRRSVVLSHQGHTFGSMGEVHPDMLQAFDLPSATVVAVLDLVHLDQLRAFKSERVAYRLSKFPGATRDVAWVVEETVTASSLIKSMREADRMGLIDDIRLFDIYRGVPIPEGKKSMAFSVLYLREDRTLTDEEVDQAHAQLMRTVEQKHQASIRA